jgi:hypothetical protein
MAYDYDRRASGYGVGFAWQSLNGPREIVGEQVHPRTGEPIFLVSTNGSRMHEMIPKDKIEREVKLDTNHYESRNKTRQVEQDQEDAKAKSDSWFGFTDKMNPIAKRRAIDTLGKMVSWNRQFGRRGDFIRDRVKRGWRAVKDPTHGEILQAPDEAFLLGRDVTKIGLEFAKYLEHHG